MKKVLFSLVLLLIAIAALGYTRGWFTVPEDPESHQRKVVVDKDKFARDRDAFKAAVSDGTQKALNKLASLRDQLKTSTGDDKAKLEKTIEDLEKQVKDLEEHAKDLDQASEEKLAKLKERLDKLLAEHGDEKKGNGK